MVQLAQTASHFRYLPESELTVHRLRSCWIVGRDAGSAW